MIFFLLAIAYFILYRFQIIHLFGGDSAEYSTISQTWGIPHPPGYPLYSFLLNFFRSIFPFIGQHVINNFFSTFPIIVSCYFIYKILKTYRLSEPIALFSSLFYLFLFPVWLYSEVPEVFGLNIFIITLISYCLVMFDSSKKNVYKYLALFSFGLGLAHHHTFVLFLPGWIILIGKSWKKFVKEDLLKNIFFVALGLIFYIYPPIASYHKTPIDWENSQSLLGFLRLITRFSYGTFKAYASSTPNIINQFFDIISALLFIIKDFKPLGVGIIIYGFYYLKKKSDKLFSFVFVSLIVYLVFIFITNFVLASSFVSATFERYLIGLYFILIFPFAFGILGLTHLFEEKIVVMIKNALLKKIVKGSSILFFLIFFVINFQSSLKTISTIPNIDQFDIFAKNILDSVPKNSIVSLSSDVSYFPTSYYYFVKKYRPDVIFLSYGLISKDYYQERLKRYYPSLVIPKESDYGKFVEQFISENSKKHDIFFEAPIQIGYWVPYGLLWKYYPVQDQIEKDSQAIIAKNFQIWESVYSIPKLSEAQRDVLFLDDLQKDYLNGLYNFSQYLIYNKKIDQAKETLKFILSYNDSFTAAKDLLSKLK